MFPNSTHDEAEPPHTRDAAPDPTPLGHLRTVRLNLVHRDLRAAGPHAGATVTQLAGRWGFWHTGRFAAQYRAVYGCSPSETLRRGE